MKHLAPQFYLPGTEDLFNLSGEVATSTAPKPAPRIDPTPALFESPTTKVLSHEPTSH